ncbi:MAG: DNA repair protein RecO [Bacilli bacterium]|nr:DNA repair protein RecO [Bacilli bacterium]
MNVKGVIVRVTPYKESGAMINLLTKEKLISFYARSIYKVDSKNVLLTSPLMYGDFTFKDDRKTNLTFKEMTPIFDVRHYMDNYAKLAAIDFINEVTVRLFNDDDMPKIYSYLIKTLELFKHENLIPCLLLAYLAVSLKLNGFGLNVDSCVITHSKTNIVGVSYLDGGLVSKSVYRSACHKLYSGEKINLLRAIFKVDANNLDKLAYSRSAINDVMNDLLIYTYDQTGLRFKSEKLINKV